MAIRRGTILAGTGSTGGGGTTNVRVQRQQSGAYYSGSVTRTPDQRAGDRISVFDFGATGDGTTDDSAAFNAAINAAIAAGAGVTVFAPSGRYAIGTGIIFPASSAVPIILEGDGAATVLLRTGSFSGVGMIDIRQCSDVTFRFLTIDGQVTSSVGVLYSTVGNNTMQTVLSDNTSIWVHAPASRIRLQSVTIRHTGGYAVLLDCQGGTLQDVRITDCLFENNRPHLFGTSGGDLNYGSWTGGVYVNGDGTTFGAGKVLRDFLVRGCTFRRNTGNCLWSHLNTDLNDLHSNFRWCDNHFEDIGLDGMMAGGLSGGVVANNTVRRNGYICSDDTSASTPRYLANKYSVGLDTAGLVKGVAYKGNTFTSPNGAAMDLDGYADGIVSGNVVRVPVPGEPEYTEDQIASTGPGGTGNVSYGAQVSNTNNHAVAGSGVQITTNVFLNLSGGAIRMYASRNGVVSDNQITHPPTPVTPPITLGNIGTGANQRAYNNLVSNNKINYSPASPQPCVFEDPTFGAFSGSDSNWVSGNQVTGNGNAFEFMKDGTTASITTTVHSTQAFVTSASETVVERQGGGNNSLTRWYGREVGTKTLIMDLHHKLFNSSVVLVGGPLLNISTNGGSGTGSVSTGGRTTLLFDDCMATGRFAADGFLALTDTTFVYPNDAAADLLPASYGLLRFNSSSGIFEKSVSVTSGHRVWSSLTGSATPGGADTQVQFNNTGAFAGSSKLTWTDSSGVLGVTGYVQASVGFNTTNTATDAIQATLGGVTVKYVIGTVSLTLGTTSTGTAGAAAGRLMFDGSFFQACEDGTNWVRITGGGGSAAGTNTQVQFNNSGAFGASSKFTWVDSSGILGLTGYVQASVGFNTTSTATDAIQATLGGVTVKYLIGTISLTLSTTSTGTAGAAAGRMIFDGTHFQVCEDGATWLRITGGSSSVAGANTEVQFNSSGSFGASSKFTWTDSSGVLGLTGYVQASVGFNTTSTATDAIQATLGGVTVKYLIGTVSMTLSTTSTGTAGAAAGRMLYDGSHFQVCEDGTNWLRITGASAGVSSLSASTGISVSASTGAVTITNVGVTSLGGSTGALNLSAGSGIGIAGLTITNNGVTSFQGFAGSITLSAGTGISISGTTITNTAPGVSYSGGTGVTVSGGSISIGQAVGTGNSVTFSSVTTTGVVQSGATSTSIAFQTTNFNFQVNGNGVVSCQQLNVAGSDVINSSRQFIGAGVDVGGNGVSAGGYNVSGGFVGQFWNIGGLSFNINGSGSFTTLVFKGGILVSAF